MVDFLSIFKNAIVLFAVKSAWSKLHTSVLNRIIRCTSVQSAFTLRSNAKVQCSSHALKTVQKIGVWNNGCILDRWHVDDVVAYCCLFATRSFKSSSRKGTKRKKAQKEKVTSGKCKRTVHTLRQHNEIVEMSAPHNKPTALHWTNGRTVEHR